MEGCLANADGVDVQAIMRERVLAPAFQERQDTAPCAGGVSVVREYLPRHVVGRHQVIRDEVYRRLARTARQVQQVDQRHARQFPVQAPAHHVVNRLLGASESVHGIIDFKEVGVHDGQSAES